MRPAIRQLAIKSTEFAIFGVAFLVLMNIMGISLSSLAIIGGAVGNLIDRIINGYVVDFIDVYYRGWHWPAFNLADSAITGGVILLLLDGLVISVLKNKVEKD